MPNGETRRLVAVCLRSTVQEACDPALMFITLDSKMSSEKGLVYYTHHLNSEAGVFWASSAKRSLLSAIPGLRHLNEYFPASISFVLE